MKQILLISCMALFILFAKPVGAFEGEHRIYADLLTSKNSAQIKVAAKSIYNKKIRTRALTDLAAEVLAQIVDRKFHIDEDTTAWVAKVIGVSKSQRYTSFLELAKASDISRKVKKHISNSLDDLTQPSGTTFVKGRVDLAEVIKTLNEQKKQQLNAVVPDNFKKVAIGSTINHVIKTLGMPTDYAITFGSRRQPWVGTIHYSMLNLIFADQGSFILHYVAKSTNWIVKSIKPGAQFAGDLASHPMMSSSPQMMRSYIKTLVKQSNATQLDRDIAAERLYTDLHNEEFIDTLSWACRLLGLSGTDRYRSTLSYVSQNSRFRKLEKYARKTLKQLPAGSSEQYKQGDVLKK